MKSKRFTGKIKQGIIFFIFTVFLSGVILMSACAGADTETTDTAKSYSRAVINSGDIVPAENIRVAEYLHYYDQYFPEPVDETIGLDLRLGNNVMPADGGMAWLQIGLQTKAAESTYVAPLNLAIVIDKSGSMNDSDKMPLVKESLKLFLESLNSYDIVSLVTYNDRAKVVVSSREVGDGSWIRNAVDSIIPSGGTNLHAGMMAGFEEVEKNYDIRRNNKVMLLTDGLANVGETDPEKIAADALAYNEKGIYLGTIGLGLDFNDPLLITLADQGEGGYSFVDSAREMDRLFREQANTFKQRVADDVRVQVLPGTGVRLIGITGYEGTPPVEGASVQLWPMSIESSQVVMVELRVTGAAAGTRELAKVRLQYVEEASGKLITEEKSISAEMVRALTGYDPTWDLEILRNVTIQQTAEGMKEIDSLFDREQYEQAWRIAVDLEKQLTEVARLTNDEQMYEDASLMRKYQQTLSDAIYQTEGRWPESEYNDSYDSERPYRGDDEYSDLPEIDIK